MVLGATLCRPGRSGALAAGALVAIVSRGAWPACDVLVPALGFAFFFVGGVAHGTKNVPRAP